MDPARLPLSFTAAMDDDLGVPAALAALHATVRDGNYALGTGDQENAVTCLAEHGVYQSGLSVVNVRDDGDVADVLHIVNNRCITHVFHHSTRESSANGKTADLPGCV